MDYASVDLGVFGFDCLTGSLGDAKTFSYLVALGYLQWERLDGALG
jgi:hypothetical protein